MRRLLLVASILLPIASPTFAVSTCEKYGVISVMSGQYKIANNVWGASTAQCIDVPNTSQNAFTVTSSSHNQPGSVASYPSVWKGCHWGDCTSGSGMPIVYSNVSSAPFSWSVTRASSGTWNIAAEAWLSPNSSSASGYNGGAEIMIWLDRNGSIQPAGSMVANNVSIAGATWEVWYSNIGWNYVAYRRTSATSSLNADLKAFIDDSVNRGWVQRSWYLHAFEAGTELMVGGAGFRSNSFTFTVNGGGGGGGTTFGLNVTRNGSGSGTVTSNPGGINCGSDCSESYASGTTVTLNQSAASGSTFAGWGGSCSGTGSCVVTMTAARSVTATFNASGGGGGTTFALNVSRSGSGTGTVTSNPGGINCGSDCNENYSSGTTVTLSQSAASGSTFAGWSGACTGTGSCTVSMTTGRSVTATFNTSGGGGGGGGGTCTTVSGGQSGNFNTSGAVCYIVNGPINGWGCSEMGNRTVTVNNTAVTCRQMPLPGSAPYTFRFSAGTPTWSSFHWW